MSTYVLMKIFESAPSRYDLGIRLITMGRINKHYEHLVNKIQKGQKVLDIGCGTGALTILAAQRGGIVKSIDINPHMLEIAQSKVNDACLTNQVELSEMGIAELGNESTESYDVVMSGLCFSDLSEMELSYTLREANRILRIGGLILIADEVLPKSIVKRIINFIVRFPLKIITYIVTQTTTHAVKNLPESVIENGFTIESVNTNMLGNFIELIARKS